ncbi:hypothetical protein GLOIN_2v1532872 [Rhizophagus irregularis DAOM 181602=DAOM 197198]|uniref:Uncharacterized protein n=1 Tax=Rhizophagus irregularis (strain DAOM 181602 / DAOM 197198 / MUCL 43194) TaxID=747089 RepID=A0A2P4QMQ9_RHIID|nr:hypothetical protein GLOIN_2v1532872 [Rhizophagus irregularis DAOM 181602=DAOM 197198]POG78878.1 hypothetical protein GLOIN_2v1532872 [Rhizophagus irregularis DAOM 181602=DAOM 197198]|eukprot:XP_025185744.1 hypothetical protein GLOIN_2v1532872 [Rhizophagus irregularis DAOM 181602=DAOM 197198]
MPKESKIHVHMLSWPSWHHTTKLITLLISLYFFQQDIKRVGVCGSFSQLSRKNHSHKNNEKTRGNEKMVTNEDISLNCINLGNDFEDIFMLEIPEDKMVNLLKSMIKK